MTSRRLFPAVILLFLAALGCSKDETPTTPSCTVVAGAITASTFGAAGGSGSVPITAGTTCAWTATISAAFVTISAGASGTGNGTISFTVAANAGAARTATLVVAGTTFTISQSAAAIAPPAAGLSAPTAASPIGGQTVATTRPTLVVNNAAATGAVGTVTYTFEISDQPGFPNDTARTVVVDGIAQGASTTAATVTRDLGTDTVHYWHARATDGTVTSAYSATETFKTPPNPVCSFTVSPAAASISNAGGAVAITVTAGSTCSWTATSNAAFITVNTASGTGNGTVTATVAAGNGPARSGTVTIAGQTVTITQAAGAPIFAAFRMFDRATQSNETTECRITSATGGTCTLESTSFPLSTNALVSYAWTVQWTDGTVITRTQDSTSPTFSFTHTCGGVDSTVDGMPPRPLSVTLTVTDTQSNTVTVTSGSGSQPPLFIRLFTC